MCIRDSVKGVRVALEDLADLVAVHVRHDDVAKHDVRLNLRQALQEVAPAPDGEHLVLGLGKGELHDFLDRNAVIGKQQRSTHGHLALPMLSTSWYHEPGALSTICSLRSVSIASDPSPSIHTTAPVSSHPGTTCASWRPRSSFQARWKCPHRTTSTPAAKWRSAAAVSSAAGSRRR